MTSQTSTILASPGQKVLVAMSGGVDSSAAAMLLKNQGYQVLGATMKLLNSTEVTPENERTCCSAKDVNDAKMVAEKLDFDYHVFNFSALFRHEVIERFAENYALGLTPNPCIDCNRFMKFIHFRERAAILDCDLIATGHYARVEFNPKKDRWLLKKAHDLSKDQSYVLYSMSQEELSRTIFPLGNLRKEEVRHLAGSKGLINALKPDSQDICFVQKGHYSEFLEKNLKKIPPPGDIVDQEGRVLGRHRGIHCYTIGQRQGLGICKPRPLYVTNINPDSNTITIGHEEELQTTSAVIDKINCIAFESFDGPLEAMVKIRYRHQEVPAEIRPLENKQLLVIFKTPQKGVAPGQAAVFYQEDLVLGGGTIIKTN